MTTFDERERAFETKFARDQEVLFKIHARRNRLLGEWAAQQLGLTQAEADGYVRDIMHVDFETGGDDVVMKKLLGDFTSAGVEVDEPTLQAQIELKTVEARRQLIEAEDF